MGERPGLGAGLGGPALARSGQAPRRLTGIVTMLARRPGLPVERRASDEGRAVVCLRSSSRAPVWRLGIGRVGEPHYTRHARTFGCDARLSHPMAALPLRLATTCRRALLSGAADARRVPAKPSATAIHTTSLEMTKTGSERPGSGVVYLERCRFGPPGTGRILAGSRSVYRFPHFQWPEPLKMAAHPCATRDTQNISVSPLHPIWRIQQGGQPHRCCGAPRK
jgi:hypothetical protein